MDLKTVVAEVESWPIDERLQLVEKIWDGLLEEGFEPEMTEELRTKLERRLDEANAIPDDVMTWEAIVDHVRRPR